MEFTKWDLDLSLIECGDCHPSAFPFALLLLILCPWAPSEATLVITIQEALKTGGNNPNLHINTASGKAAYITSLYNITCTSYIQSILRFSEPKSSISTEGKDATVKELVKLPSFINELKQVNGQQSLTISPR